MTKADGVLISESIAIEKALQIAKDMPKQKSSTAQDMYQRKPSEIDFLNGYIIRCKVAVEIPTPINQTLYSLLKLMESDYTEKP